jgi:hypothetical protein
LSDQAHRFWLGLILAACFVALSVFSSGSAHAESPKDILVIVNRKIPVKSLTTDDIKFIFLRKQLFWPRGGGSVVPIHARSGTELKIEFLKRGLDLTEKDEEAYWRTKQIQTGLTPPAEFTNTLKAIFKLSRAVGYVFRSDYKEGVTTVVLILPAEK